MPEVKLGTKFECFNCGTKFYDLGKSEPVCPKCGANQKDAVQAESPAVTQAARRKRKAEVLKTIEPAEEEEETAVEEIADDEIEATPDLDPDLAEAEEEEVEDED
jgi:uncharacterized protein (TIGR02300 family)